VIEKILNNKISNKSLLIFDLDGTLINTDEVNFFAYKEAIQKVKKLDLHILHKNNERFTREKLYSMIEHLSAQEHKNIIEIKNDVYHKYLHKSKVNHYILEVIIKFAQTNKIVLATSSHKSRANMVLEYHSLKNIFDYKFYKEDYENNNKFLHVLDYLNVDPSIAIVFENDSNEIKKAILSGIPNTNIVNIQP
jgi:beta-phosphoglucomutase-like phosphatase (HAD superfamily)